MLDPKKISMTEPAELRNTLGHFATGVAIVCTKIDAMSPIGITVNSFSSLSLKPPLVLWSLQNNSDSFHIFEKASHYSVNILAEKQISLANQFARKGGHAMEKGEYITTENHCIVLPEAIANFECDIEKRIEAGDHTIYIGKVKCASIQCKTMPPLLFYQGQYKSLID